MKVRTKVRAGGYETQHNCTLVRRPIRTSRALRRR